MSKSKWKRMGLKDQEDFIICPNCRYIFINRKYGKCPKCKIRLVYPTEHFNLDDYGFYWKDGKWNCISDLRHKLDNKQKLGGS